MEGNNFTVKAIESEVIEGVTTFKNFYPFLIIDLFDDTEVCKKLNILDYRIKDEHLNNGLVSTYSDLPKFIEANQGGRIQSKCQIIGRSGYILPTYTKALIIEFIK